MKLKHLKTVALSIAGSLILSGNVMAANIGVINVNNLNVRSGPASTYSIISKKNSGQTVTILNQKNNWYEIKLNDKKSAFVHSDYVDIISKKATVTASKLNVRKEPSLDSTRIGQFIKGTKVQILKESGEWYYVTDSKLTGYVAAEYLEINKEETTKQETTNEKTVEKKSEEKKEEKEFFAVTNVDVLNIRQKPDVNSNIVGKTYINEQLTVSEIFDEWVEIILSNGNKGYLFKEYVDVVEKTEVKGDVSEELINYAKKFLGNPYVYGGNSLTNGIDCSGYTQQIFAKFGYKLNRSSRTQINDGTRVSNSNLEPADLVFYGYNGYISHVAIYIGNNKIIHASTPRTGIIISNLDFGMPRIGATRILK